jgi:hypothetical protein
MRKALKPNEEMKEGQKLLQITNLCIALFQIVQHPPLISGQCSPYDPASDYFNY